MPDISMCQGNKCPLKETCYRFKATASSYQSYFSVSPIKEDNTCDYYMEYLTKNNDNTIKSNDSNIQNL